MATAGSKKVTEYPSAPEKDEDGDKCQICKEKFRRPKLLPCFHTFCQECLQGVAGASCTFPCPTCRTPVTPPLRGIERLPTNYVKDDLRLCDVCDKKAAGSCFQCKLRFCPYHSAVHGSTDTSNGHTMVPVTFSQEEGKCGTETLQGGICAKHPDQRLLFHCSTCRVDLCKQCQVTQHEGHPVQHLADAQYKVKEKLNNTLWSLRVNMEQIDDTVQKLHNDKLALEAQMGHIQHVLKYSQTVDLLFLENQLTSDPASDVDTKERGKYVSGSDMIITPKPSESADSNVSETLPRTKSGAAVVDLYASLGTNGNKEPCELYYSENPQSVVVKMCPINRGRLWVLYNDAPQQRLPLTLKLYNDKGKVLANIKHTSPQCRLLSISDVLLMTGYVKGYFKTALISPDGHRTAYSMGTGVTCFVSNDHNDIHYVLADESRKLQIVEFSSASGSQTDSTVWGSVMPHPQSQATPGSSPMKDQVSHTVLNTVYLPREMRGDELSYVSAGGKYLAYVCVRRFFHLNIYTMTDPSSRPFQSGYYHTTGFPRDVRFCVIDGRDVMLVAVQNENRVSIADPKGMTSRALGYLDTGSVLVEGNPICLATDTDQHVWIGYNGGKVVRVDLRLQTLYLSKGQ